MPMGEPPHEYISRPDQLTDGRFPTRHDLDAVAPDHAVYIRAVWGWWSRRPFPSVANSLALTRAGVTRDTRGAAQCRDRQGCARRADRRVPRAQFRAGAGIHAVSRSAPLQVLRSGRERAARRAHLCGGRHDLALRRPRPDADGDPRLPRERRAQRAAVAHACAGQHAERGVRRQTADGPVLSLCRPGRRPRPRRRHPARRGHQSRRPCRRDRRRHHRGRLSVRSVGRAFLPGDDAASGSSSSASRRRGSICG